MLELHALGGLTLQGAGAVQPKRLALLCYLALGGTRGFHRRDNLLALFWPELDESHARQSLRQALVALRTLDGNIVVTRGDDEVSVAPGGLGADVLAFEEALQRNALVTALERYTGPFLQGFFLTECAEFERWVERERARLAGLAADAAWKLAEAEERPPLAVQWARRAAALQPDDEGALRRLMTVLDRAGDRAGALREYEAFARALRKEYGAEPAPETQALRAAVRERAEPRAFPIEATRLYGATLRQPPARYRAGRLVLGALAGIAIAGAAVGIIRSRSGADPALEPNSIAVLPFANPSSDTADVYFADGMTDEIGNRLTQLGRLQVKARGLVRAQLRRTPEPTAASRALGVTWLLDGDVRHVGSQLLVNVNLVRARTGEEVWAARFSRKDGDVFAVQAEVAESVAAIVVGRLTPSERTAITRRPTRNNDAYRLYLYGNTLAKSRTRLQTRRAVQAFEEAVRLDPEFAGAWARLGLARDLLYNWGWVDSVAKDSMLTLAVVAARHALALDSLSSEAWLAMGSTHIYNWDWYAAQAAFERAIHLDSLNADAFHLYGTLLYGDQSLDDYDAAAPLLRRALLLDPGSRNTWRVLSASAIHAGRLREAEALIDTALSFGDWSVGFHQRLFIRFLLGNAVGALADVAEAERLDSAPMPDARALIAVLVGDSTGARAVLARLRAQADSGREVLADLATYAMSLGRRDEALTALERLRAKRNPREPRCAPTIPCSVSLRTWFLLHDQRLAPLKGDPRFERLWEETRPRVPWLEERAR